MSGKKKRSIRKRQKPAIQVELPLPGPQGELPPVEAPTLPWWQRRASVAGLALLAFVMLLMTVYSEVAAHRAKTQARELDSAVTLLTLRPATREQTLRIEPNPRSWSASPDSVIRWPEPPELLEMYFPVTYAGHSSFAIYVDKVDHGRVMVAHRIRPDSNGDLRLSVNSSALGEGEFRIRLQGYTRLGQLKDVGWARLVINPPRGSERSGS